MTPARFLLEMVLLFLAFFLPGYLSQSGFPASGAVGTSAMMQSMLVGVPQFLLMAYVASLSRETSLESWGFSPIRGSDALRVALVLVGCFAIFAPLTLLMTILPASVAKYLSSGFRWRLAGASQIPLAVAFGLVAGYREEFFFRSYLLRRLEQLGFPAVLSVAVSTLLFCAGHVYQGPLGLATSAGLGVLFAVVYLRRRSLHVIAIAHGLYNAIVLCLSLLHTPPLSNAVGMGTFLQSR
jgi:CAAX protease family protein